MIEFRQVGKSFKRKDAVSNVSFGIQAGEVAALLGPNGAGKSTMIRLLLGLQKADAGTITVFGRQPGTHAVREQTGVMLQEVSVPNLVSVREVLEQVRGYYADPLPLEELAELAGLEQELLGVRTEKLSGGQKRRVNFALALAGNPELLVLDEPTVGMDAPSRRRFWETVSRLAGQGVTVLFTTHYIEEAEQAATRILLVEDGELTYDVPPSELKQQLSVQQISFRHAGSLTDELLGQLTVTDVRTDGPLVTLFTPDADRLLNELLAHGVELRELTIRRGTLEDAYTALTMRKEAG
ncbi:ABC transporter ATP-binding protein [Sporosarcina trichiuri]|uniref:ABC transporter ATP-binding protein n=1 Tax=Sporosarcina trichiuri TaxID=3056445 RepID=UPI0025B407C7|nr:ABC transporter ATP-binding protein [Sporosarcina sp. 0.2-SM1T-5]WJY26244.1 ABC transporter ATP-binding protein [Sporosarcina sp. 0.2-SM1T-5]